MSEIAILEDEPSLRELLSDVLGADGHTTRAFGTVAAAELALATWAPDLLLLDVKLPDGDGLQLLDRLRGRSLAFPVIVSTAFGTVDRAVQALRAGAADFLVKPVDNARLRAAVAQALADAAVREELAMTAGGAVTSPDAERALVGASGALRDVLAIVDRVAGSDVTVLVRGESGTGKELVARALHAGSPRRDGPFVSVNCAALAPTLVESELFGFERGAFTGAHAERKGLVESAHGGTLFLDEMGDMPLDAQSKLLRVLQEREVVRVGGRKPIAVDVRVVAATHRDLEARVREGAFRQDLWYRLAVVPLELPPLRARLDDVAPLIDHFLDKHARRHRLAAPRPAASVLAWARAQAWPGNVRELENWVERAVVMGQFQLSGTPSAGGTPATAIAAVPPPARASRPPEAELEPLPEGAARVRTLRQAVADAERAVVVEALREARGNKAQAARLLGISYKTLFNKIHEHDIKEELTIG
jgi:DNA-binding NtrC family response regulator